MNRFAGMIAFGGRIENGLNIADLKD